MTFIKNLTAFFCLMYCVFSLGFILMPWLFISAGKKLRKKKKVKGEIIMKKNKIVALLMAVYVLMALCACGKKAAEITPVQEKTEAKVDSAKETETVDPFEDVTVKFTGYDGYGTAEIVCNDRYIEPLLQYDLTQPLKNGETLKVYIDKYDGKDYESETGFSLDSLEKEYVIEGLDPIETVDGFENVKVTFEGIAPNGTATVENITRSLEEYVDLSCDYTDHLSNGDKIKVTFAPKDAREFANKFGEEFETTEKEYTVEGLLEYAGGMDDIPEEALTKMQEKADRMIVKIAEDFNSGNNMYSQAENKTSGELVGTVLLKGSDKTDDYNRLYFVYKVTRDIGGKTIFNCDLSQPKVYYYFVAFKDIAAAGDQYQVDFDDTITTSEKDGIVSWAMGQGLTEKVEGIESFEDLKNCIIEKYKDQYGIINELTDPGSMSKE